MPNYTGSFMDQSAEVIVEDIPDELEEVADDQPYTGIHLASARATPDVEFICVTLAPGQSTKVLQYDQSRVSAGFNVVGAASGAVVLSTSNVNYLPTGSAIPPVFPGTAPVFVLPNNQNNAPGVQEFRTQSELWLYNAHSTAIALVSIVVERYSER